MHCFTALEARSLQSRYQQSWFLLKTVREETVPRHSQLIDGLFPNGSLHIIFPLCVSLHPIFFLSGQQWIRAHLKGFILTEVLGVGTLTYEFWDNTILPITMTSGEKAMLNLKVYFKS